MSSVEGSESSWAGAPTLYTEVSTELGLDFHHRADSYANYAMPAIMGSGGCVFDYDDDGDLDLYLINSGAEQPTHDASSTAPNRLYRQEADGRFADVTRAAGLGDTGYGMGCAVGDVNNDGDVDVYVTNWGADALYENNGDGTFRRAGAEAGIRGDGWSTSAAFLDFDRDGHLDLYVTRYVKPEPEQVCAVESGQREFCGPTASPGVSDILYHNLGDGRFEDTTAQAGIESVRDAGLGVLAADLDDDGWMDLYVANDADPNNLWINQRDGSFVDEAVLLGAAYNQHGLSEAGMGVTAGDIDEDGDLDLFVTHLIEESNTYYQNLGALGFEDTTAAVGLGLPGLGYTGFGTAFFDYDNDGDLDVAVVNGAVKRRPLALHPSDDSFWSRYREPNLLLANDGRGSFIDTSKRTGHFGNAPEVSRGLIPADLDRDGDLDLLVTNLEGPARLYRNDYHELQTVNSWIEIRVVDPVLKREALGARVSIVTRDRTYVRHALPPGGYLTSSHPRIHLGLGSTERVERFEVHWPDGQEEVFAGTRARQVVELRKREGEGKR